MRILFNVIPRQGLKVKVIGQGQRLGTDNAFGMTSIDEDGTGTGLAGCSWYGDDFCPHSAL